MTFGRILILKPKYKLISKSLNIVSIMDIAAIPEVAAVKTSSETYYNSDDGFKYYSIINSVDYSGMGIWEEMVE